MEAECRRPEAGSRTGEGGAVLTELREKLRAECHRARGAMEHSRQLFERAARLGDVLSPDRPARTEEAGLARLQRASALLERSREARAQITRLIAHLRALGAGIPRADPPWEDATAHPRAPSHPRRRPAPPPGVGSVPSLGGRSRWPRR